MGRSAPQRRGAAVWFYLAGVVIDTMPLHARAWQDTFRPLGIPVARQSIYEREGEPGLVTAHTLLARHGVGTARRTVTALLREKERRFRQLARHVHVDRRLVQLLRWLSRRGLRVGLVTGTSSREVARIVPKRVLRAFRVVVTGDRVRQGKPHPEPYQRAFRRLGVSANHSLVVENAPYGIRSAQRAGSGFVLAIASSLPNRRLQEADLVVTSVSQLCRTLTMLIDTGSHLATTERRNR